MERNLAYENLLLLMEGALLSLFCLCNTSTSAPWKAFTSYPKDSFDGPGSPCSTCGMKSS